MARTKEFDPEIALRAAMELFWERGYEATSITDLTEHLGISRASLYATFGGKHDLYLKAIDHYLQSRDPSPIELLSGSGPALPAVRALVELYVQESLCDDKHRGCLMVNAATERLPGDALVSRRVESGWDTIEVALTSALMRARAQGELAADKDPRGLARFLLTVLQGMRVLAKGSTHHQRLRDAADYALAALD